VASSIIIRIFSLQFVKYCVRSSTSGNNLRTSGTKFQQSVFVQSDLVYATDCLLLTLQTAVSSHPSRVMFVSDDEVFSWLFSSSAAADVVFNRLSSRPVRGFSAESFSAASPSSPLSQVHQQEARPPLSTQGVSCMQFHDWDSANSSSQLHRVNKRSIISRSTSSDRRQWANDTSIQYNTMKNLHSKTDKHTVSLI